MPDITITLDEKTWAQLCLLAHAREPELSPTSLAKKFIIQDVVNFTRAKALGEFIVTELESQDDDSVIDQMNEEIEKRMGNA